MDYKTTKLNNGLRIIMSRNPHDTTATIMVYVNIGLNWEPDNINGISHFVEHMFFKGTKKRPSQLIISTELTKYGANDNAYTSSEHTCYHIYGVDRHLSEIIEILGDIITNSLYRSEDIEIEKNVVINEIHQRYSSNKQDYFFNKNFFKGLPLSRTIVGPDENIRKLNRPMILAFLKKFYTPENMVISVAGNFPSYEWLHKQLKKNFDNDFNKHFSDTSPDFTKTLKDIDDYKTQWEPILKLAQTPSLNNFNINKMNYHLSHTENSKHTKVTLAFVAVKYTNDNEKFKCRMLADILGGGMYARLFQEIRNKHGLVYGVYSSTEEYDFNGIFKIYYSCNHDIETQKKILELIKKNIDKIKNEPVTQEEYDNLISCYENANRISLSNSYTVCSHFGYQCLKKDSTNIFTLPEIIKQYKKISIADLQEYANKLFDWNKFMIFTNSPIKLQQSYYTNLFTNPYVEKLTKKTKKTKKTIKKIYKKTTLIKKTKGKTKKKSKNK
jgi:predicted Zn-dependent peptidase